MTRVLIVEDSPTQAERLTLILQSAGFETVVARDGEEGFKLLGASPIDLVISDIVMPGMSGYELCRAIKADRQRRHVPVVLLSTLSEPMDIVGGLECGADNFLTKPYQPDQLIARVQSILHNRALRAERNVALGVEIAFLGKKIVITSEKEQILDLLVSTFEDMVRANQQLTCAQADLTAATEKLASHAETLERRVHERTRELERSSEELRDHHALLAAIFRSSPVGIYLLDGEGRVMMWNAAAERIFGFSEAEALGRTPPFVDLDQIDEFRRNFVNMSKGQSADGVELRRRRKDGSVVDINLAWTALRSDRGDFRGIVHAVTDVTERRQVEDQLRQAQKMEVVGQLTGGVAHDFNNLLGIVVGNLDLLREQLDIDAESAELLNEALGAALRGAEVTRQLLAFSRRQPLQPKLVAPNEIVLGMTKLLARAIGEHIKVRLELPDDAWSVVIDPAQLESALLNLAVNARDAMPQGGALTIETANFSFDSDEAQAHVEGVAGDYLVVAVSDTGTGMAPEIVGRVFEPFFSTKGTGKGTGLGLSMVYGFVKQSGGNAKIYSEVGAGTTIRLYLPRAAADARREDAAAVTAVPSRGGERVLVVEDNEALRRLALRQLHDLGYETMEAATGVAGLAVLESDAPIDLLFTDIVMPGGVDGRELARHAAALRPGIKILFTSGFTAAAGAEVTAELADKLISKPFRKTELAQRIRTALDAHVD